MLIDLRASTDCHAALQCLPKELTARLSAVDSSDYQASAGYDLDPDSHQVHFALPLMSVLQSL